PTRFHEVEARTHLPDVTLALGLERYVLFGHSVGGAMALTAAALQPARCVAVITESAQAFVEERTRSGIQAAKQGFADRAQFEKLKRWHGSRASWVLDAWTEIWLSAGFREWSLDPWLSQVRRPVLAIHGDSDEYGSIAFPQKITQGVGGPARMALMASC